MKLEAEELATLADHSCTLKNHAEGHRMAFRLDPVGKPQGEIFVTNSRTRLYWTRDPASACLLLNAFRDLGDFATLFRDRQNLNEFVVCRRSLLEPHNRSCCGVA